MKASSFSRRAAFGALAGGTLVAAAALAASGRSAPAPELPPRPVKLLTVRSAGVAAQVTYPGTVQPRYRSDLAFRVSGRVTRRFVNVGDSVAPGTILATIDQEDLELGLRSAQAQLASARAELGQAQLDVGRYEQIKNSPAFSQATYDRRRNTLAVAAAKVRDAEAQVQLRQNQRDYATLVSDQFGVVTAARVEAGQVVNAGDPVFAVARAGDLEIAVSVPEHQVAGLNDSRATVTLWTMPDTALEARLREVAASADPITRTYDVRFALTEMPADLQLGMSATVMLQRPEAAAVVEIPLTAVFQTADAPAVWVFDAATGKLSRRTVVVAAYRRETALVSAGLNDGEQIVAAGVHRLDESQRVRALTTDAV